MARLVAIDHSVSNAPRPHPARRGPSSPADWYALFPNAVLAEGALDRLVNSAHHVIFRGRTYRPLRRPDGGGTPPPLDETGRYEPLTERTRRTRAAESPQETRNGADEYPARRLPTSSPPPRPGPNAGGGESRYDPQADGAPEWTHQLAAGGPIRWPWVDPLPGRRQGLVRMPSLHRSRSSGAAPSSSVSRSPSEGELCGPVGAATTRRGMRARAIGAHRLTRMSTERPTVPAYGLCTHTEPSSRHASLHQTCPYGSRCGSASHSRKGSRASCADT